MQNIFKFSKIGAGLHIPSLAGDRTNPSTESPMCNGWLKNRVGAKILIGPFRRQRQFNEVWPHVSLAQLTPAQFKKTTSINLVRAIY
jgi:hypothetical protein